MIDKLLDKVAVGEGRRLSELLRFHAFFHCKRYQGSVSAGEASVTFLDKYVILLMVYCQKLFVCISALAA